MNLDKEQLPLFEGFKAEAIEGQSENILSEMLNELMEEREITPAMIHKATRIPWQTLMDMLNGKNRYQKLNNNILELAKYFNVSIHYLAFGIGTDEPVFNQGNENG